MALFENSLECIDATKWDYSNGWLEVKIDKDRKREMERSFDFWQGKKVENAKMESESDWEKGENPLKILITK